ncbi:MAG TPA: 4-phosphoerythronate dehydrogenase [Pseudomonadales bacterium]|nr:4-phosphoerythronate dehydrogenase [Pseudomonadales bacterium]HRG51132.1 4-phosphoerythronate dehydrogenase [Pseudomonadales bacterium]
MKIVADENIAYAKHFFAELGELVLMAGRSITTADVRDADVLLVRSVTLVNRALLAGSAVKFVGSCTIGTDHVDQNYLTEAGIHFAFAPGCNAQAVVEYVWAALQGLAVDVTAARVGVVGCGNVGGRLLRALHNKKVNAVGNDPFLSYEDFPLVDLNAIMQCDVICLHTPLTKIGAHPTIHLFDQSRINQLKAGAVLLNAGRGAVIDNAALLQRLEQKQDLQVVLDVWENEPAIDGNLLAQVAIGTPHIAGYSAEGKLRGTEMVYEALCAFLQQPQRVAPVALTGVVEPYDIFADDAALREQYPVDGALAFDRLRKFYQPRRECGI